jgi:magnesium chelatase family protein
MSLATVASRALAGIDAPAVAVEVHLGPGLPSFTIVGLPDTEVREAKDRVRAALNHTQFEFPARRITVNLAPADLPKDSGRFDLPIAIGILAASGQIDGAALAAHEFAGELSLNGELRPVRGALAMALQARASARAFILPEPNAPQAALAEGAHVLPARTLLEVVAHLTGEAKLPRFESMGRAPSHAYPDFSEVKGQPQAKRALEVAASGGHSVLMIGPPGTGKSMLAARFPGILPPMSEAEALEVAAIHSVSAAGFEAARWGERPYRAPHHSASGAAMVGGGWAKTLKFDFRH